MHAVPNRDAAGGFVNGGRLEGKVALVTGGASGMGAAAVRLFCDEGARVVATDVNSRLLADLVSELGAQGYRAVAVEHDVSDHATWRDVVEKAITEFGTIDILVNNAGIATRTGVLDTQIDQWNRVLAVNTTGTWLGMRAVIPVMQRSGGGSIINTSSIAGLVAAGGGGGAAYSASKGAIRSLTKHAAAAFAKDRIRVNSVHPGAVFTPFVVREGITTVEEMGQAFGGAAFTPLPPHATEAIDVARAYLYLASEDSRFVTGAELVIDGGSTIR